MKEKFKAQRSRDNVNKTIHPVKRKQNNILMDCIGGNPVSAHGLGGNSPWKIVDCSPHLEVALRPYVSARLA